MIQRGKRELRKEKGMNKKGDFIVLETTIFLVLNILFFMIIFIFIRSSSNNDLIYEQTYAKQIALFIDNSKPGVEISLDVSQLYNIASNNHFSGNVVMIDNANRKVKINLVDGKGYSYGYFTNSSIIWSLDKEQKRLIMGVK
ncbi:MAG: hypothetical protein WC979_05175 [Candidatus Pacearchaeota archaeon]|jgi:hypothetical protein